MGRKLNDMTVLSVIEQYRNKDGKVAVSFLNKFFMLDDNLVELSEVLNRLEMHGYIFKTLEDAEITPKGISACKD